MSELFNARKPKGLLGALSNLLGQGSNPKIAYASYDNYDYYDTPIRSKSDHYGSLSGHGGYCEEDTVSIALLVTTVAGILLMGYILLTKIQANGGRKKREEEIYGVSQLITSITEHFVTGMH